MILSLTRVLDRPFLSGFGRSLDLFPSGRRLPRFLDDADAMASDWSQVGDDLTAAMKAWESGRLDERPIKGQLSLFPDEH